jgi:rhamnose utilization protein RhaD (predicted bifunctional aldolase and dehydrogenase)
MSGGTVGSELQALRSLSAALGGNRFRTQGAGGNTSIKENGVMWIKASGRQLAEALDRDIMVPVALEELRAAARRNDPAADSAAPFVIDDLNTAKLRPSIETSVHAILPHAVVAHIHCVETIALAVREDGEAAIAERLAGLADVVSTFIPYCRPGLPLARAILETSAPEANVLIFGNHGLVVCGADVAEVADRTNRVCNALAAAPRQAPAPDIPTLEGLTADSEYRLPRDIEAHRVALDPVNAAIAAGASLYPDHVIFLGPGVVSAPDIAAGGAMRSEGRPDRPPAMLLLPGAGVVLHKSANAAADGMALCLADVVARIPAGAAVRRLTPAQEYELTHWEAEKYRQALAAKANPP